MTRLTRQPLSASLALAVSFRQAEPNARHTSNVLTTPQQPLARLEPVWPGLGREEAVRNHE